MDAVVTLGTTESIGNILHVATSACTGIAAVELVGLGAAGLGLLALLPILLMALSMAWYKITGQDENAGVGGWVIMLAAGLAWFGLGAYGYATSASSWDIYQIVGSMSIAMAAVCFLLGYSSRKAKQQAIAKLKIKVEEPPTRKSYADRYDEWEQGSSLKSKREREDERYKNL